MSAMHGLMAAGATRLARVLSISVLAAASVAVSRADAPRPVTVADYARAERFLSWNEQSFVRNGDLMPHWIGEEDRFWYLRTTPEGAKEFIVVDAATGKRSPAFHQGLVAAALSSAVGKKVDPRRLPFASFRYTPDRAAIQFRLDSRLWTCALSGFSCSSVPPPWAPHEVVSPDGRRAAFLENGNVWIRQRSGDAFALTSDGIEHYSYAGPPGYSTHSVTDRRRGRVPAPHVLWSPDSRYILTHRLDEREVEDLFLVQSVPEDGSARPKLYTYRYAMPGDQHVPTQQLVIFDVATKRRIEVRAAAVPCSTKTMIERHEVWWSEDGKVLYYLDRGRYSRSLSLNAVDPATGTVREVVRETSKTFIQTNANTVFDRPLIRTLSNGDVIWYSARDGWGHLYRYDSRGALLNQITHGQWVVRGIIRVDDVEGRIYFMASGREEGRDPYEQRLYSVRLDGSDLRLLTPEEAEHRGGRSFFNPLKADPLATERERGHFSASGRYFVDIYSRPDQPPVTVLRAADGRLIDQVEAADISKLREGGYTPVQPFSALAADGETPVYGNLYRPSTFDAAKMYPVIDAIYPGPQTIRSGKTFAGANFGNFEAQSLAELGFIVVTIDGRGTPQRSRAFLEYSYGRMEHASELADHVAVIRQLARRYSYMDLDRVGIDGASGGGYAAARGILTYPNFYKVAVSAEGNHDQRAYLASWGETYIGPADDGDYLASRTAPLAANLRGKLLLMHGELDDNVSPTLTMKLVDALIQANKDFDLLIIPNADHDAFMSPYFIRRKWDYFVENLMGAEPPPSYWIQRSS